MSIPGGQLGFILMAIASVIGVTALFFSLRRHDWIAVGFATVS